MKNVKRTVSWPSHMILKKDNIRIIIQQYFFMALGCISYALSIQGFLVPNSIVGGGISGAASLIHLLTKLPVGIFIILLNVPILLIGLKLKGLSFIIRCLITIVVLGVFTNLLANITPVTDNPLLAAMFGGLFQGIGIGLFIKYEVSSGGTELLGRITHHFIPFQSIAVHTALLDCIIVVTGAILLTNIENILYALILIFVSAKVSDIIISGINKSKVCFIITEKAEEIADYLMMHSPRGITLFNGIGMYSKLPKKMLMTCIKNNQLSHLKLTIKSFDSEAFLIISETNEVYGKGFDIINK